MNESNPQVLIGDSPAFRRLLNAARMVAPTDANVLLIGEDGSGKETIAREIHGRSRRADCDFNLFECAGICGSERDGGLQASLRAARGGTLFLREVGELPEDIQARLLRLMDGGAAGGKGQVRIVAASSRDLWQSVQAGRFREDLYFRLCVVPLEIPPLRDRVQDIGPLLENFLESAAAEYGEAPPRFSATAERQLRRHAWPGNIRELRNFCQRMVILFPDSDLRPDNLPWEVRRGDVTRDEDAFAFKLPASGINLKELEMEVIRQALALAGGNKSRAARLLGLTRDTLLYRIQKYLIKA
jgi:DNA-binding NtrC family response regulator